MKNILYQIELEINIEEKIKTKFLNQKTKKLLEKKE
jgi:hypothetical protein